MNIAFLQASGETMRDLWIKPSLARKVVAMVRAGQFRPVMDGCTPGMAEERHLPLRHVSVDDLICGSRTPSYIFG